MHGGPQMFADTSLFLCNLGGHHLLSCHSCIPQDLELPAKRSQTIIWISSLNQNNGPFSWDCGVVTCECVFFCSCWENTPNSCDCSKGCMALALLASPRAPVVPPQKVFGPTPVPPSEKDTGSPTVQHLCRRQAGSCRGGVPASGRPQGAGLCVHVAWGSD